MKLPLSALLTLAAAAALRAEPAGGVALHADGLAARQAELAKLVTAAAEAARKAAGAWAVYLETGRLSPAQLKAGAAWTAAELADAWTAN